MRLSQNGHAKRGTTGVALRALALTALTWGVAAAGCSRPSDEAAGSKAPGAAPGSTPAAAAQAGTGQAGSTVAIVNGRIYVSPTDAPIEGGTVLIAGGRVTAVGRAPEVTPPAGATIIDAAGQSITAGFWNSHVHFMRKIWEASATAPADTLSAQMDTMLTRHGFTSVMDTGSFLDVTTALRARIDKGEVRGPHILTAGEIIFPPGAMQSEAPPWAINRPMFEAKTPAEATSLVNTKLDQGADAVKLYMATWWQPRVHLAPAVAVAAATAAHARGKLVLAHPTDRAGIDNALDAGVDVIVHTAPDSGVWDQALLTRLTKQKVSVVPTLKLWREELAKDNAPPAAIARFQGLGIAQLRAFSQAGGDVLFGTDVGYMEDDDIREEITQMGAAGLTARQILASLTTSPASRFGRADLGRLTVGVPADLVILQGNPDEDLLAFTRVQRVLSGGKTIWTAGKQEKGGL